MPQQEILEILLFLLILLLLYISWLYRLFFCKAVAHNDKLLGQKKKSELYRRVRVTVVINKS